MPRAESDNTEKPVKKYNIEINPVKIKEIVSDELKKKAVEAIKTRKKRVAKEIYAKPEKKEDKPVEKPKEEPEVEVKKDDETSEEETSEDEKEGDE
jgi:hypothetical protein